MGIGEALTLFGLDRFYTSDDLERAYNHCMITFSKDKRNEVIEAKAVLDNYLVIRSGKKGPNFVKDNIKLGKKIESNIELLNTSNDDLEKIINKDIAFIGLPNIDMNYYDLSLKLNKETIVKLRDIIFSIDKYRNKNHGYNYNKIMEKFNVLNKEININFCNDAFNQIKNELIEMNASFELLTEYESMREELFCYSLKEFRLLTDIANRFNKLYIDFNNKAFDEVQEMNDEISKTCLSYLNSMCKPYLKKYYDEILLEVRKRCNTLYNNPKFREDKLSFIRMVIDEKVKSLEEIEQPVEVPILRYKDYMKKLNSSSYVRSRYNRHNKY